MQLFRRNKKHEEEKAQEQGGKKKKLTKKEKEKAEAELRANLPTRGQVGRKGVFEMTGPLAYTFAVGQIPGGPFYSIDVIIKGHLLYIFEFGAGSMPSLKPRGFFMVKRAIVTEIGVLQVRCIGLYGRCSPYLCDVCDICCATLHPLLHHLILLPHSLFYLCRTRRCRRTPMSSRSSSLRSKWATAPTSSSAARTRSSSDGSKT